MRDDHAEKMLSPATQTPIDQLRRDQRRRWQQGERVSAAAYAALYPDLHSDVQGFLALIIQEVDLQVEQGETPQLEEYLAHYPQFSDQLRQHFAAYVRPHETKSVPPSLPPAPPLLPQDQEATPPSLSPSSVPPSLQHLATHMSISPAEPVFQRPPGSGQLRWPALPGYEILAVLGRGGMGIVYKAEQVRLKRLVAIKMILSGQHAGTEALARFRLEAEAVARLQHPNIVQIYEIGEQDGQPYYSLEFVDGTTLEKKIGGRPQPVREAAETLEILARAMHTAHQRQIVHRDLKPANVLVTATGVPKITDFGLAKRLEEGGLTGSEAIMGTPLYMAPEQAWGRNKEIGPHTDVYALGAILYEMLTGSPPLDGSGWLEILERVRTQEPVPPRRSQAHVPRDLETICLKCLQKEIPKRYASAEALAEDLRRFLDHRPILARPVGVPARLAKAVRRRPLVATLSGLLLLATLVGLPVGTWLSQQKQQAEEGKVAVEKELERRDLAQQAETREDWKDYAAVTNGRGVLEPIGKPLSLEQLRRRSVTYRFQTLGGRTEEVQVVKGRGQLTTQHAVGGYIDDLFEAPTERKRECRYVAERDAKGRVINEIAYDRAGQVVYRFRYDPETNLGNYVNAKGLPLARAGTGAAFVSFEWSDKGLQKEMRYLDKDGQPRAGHDGTYGLRMEYTSEGLVAEVMLLDADGQPMENKYGFAKMTLSYDNQANLIEKAFYGLDGRSQAHRDGYARIQLAYDPHGNHIQTACFGLDGQPCLHRDHFARQTMLYDEAGNCVETAYWGLTGQPALHAHGYARARADYDEHGNEIAITYFDPTGQATRTVEGYARVVRQFDAQGNATVEAYFGPAGEPVPHQGGYARLRRQFDARGMVTERAYLDLDGQLILHSEEHYAKKTLRYDTQGHVIESAFFGADGEPILQTDGYARISQRYEERGNPREQCYFGLDGQPTLCRYGYAKITWTYDANGNCTEENYSDLAGRPVRCLDKYKYAEYARVIWAYDRWNHRTNASYFDEAGKPLPAMVGVRKVLPGGEGERYGLLPSDILYRYEGKGIRSKDWLEHTVRMERKDDKPKRLVLVRNGKELPPLEVSAGWLHGVQLLDKVPAPWYKPR